MSYTPFTVERFRGLNTRDDPQEIGAESAVDILNIDFNRPGRIRVRDGLTEYVTTSAGAASLLWATPTRMYYVRGSSLDKISGGTATNLGSISGVPSIAELGTPTSTLSFFAVLGSTMTKYDGTTYGTSIGKPRFVATSPWDNRLVQADFSAAGDIPTGSSATGSRSTVVFSDAGAPETYGANNYLYLHPGDGEIISGMVAWRDLLFVFKQTKVFVFYGVSTSGTGTPIFNYRVVKLPSELRGDVYSTAPGADGVFVSCEDGIYLTAGDVPRIISRPVDGIFDGTAGVGMAAIHGGDMSLRWAYGRLYCQFTTQGDLPADNLKRWLVWNSASDDWSVFEMGDGSVAYPLPADYGGGLYTAKNGKILSFDSDATDDDGTAIVSLYQSGFYDLGDSEVKRVRKTYVWGYGSPRLAVFTDHGATDAGAGMVTLGTAPAVDEGYQLVARKGNLFSHKLSSGSGAWSVSRLSHLVAARRVAGVR